MKSWPGLSPPQPYPIAPSIQYDPTIWSKYVAFIDRACYGKLEVGYHVCIFYLTKLFIIFQIEDVFILFYIGFTNTSNHAVHIFCHGGKNYLLRKNHTANSLEWKHILQSSASTIMLINRIKFAYEPSRILEYLSKTCKLCFILVVIEISLYIWLNGLHYL